MRRRSIDKVRPDDDEDEDEDDLDAEAGADEEPPSVAKFQLPAAERRRVTRGSSRRSDSIRRCFDVISGTRAMPTRTSRAVTNGSRLNAGSSPIDKSSTTAPAEKSESEIRRIATSRPSAALIAHASCGRNRSMLTRSDTARAAAVTTATRMAPAMTIGRLRMDCLCKQRQSGCRSD